MSLDTLIDKVAEVRFNNNFSKEFHGTSWEDAKSFSSEKTSNSRWKFAVDVCIMEATEFLNN